MNLPRRPRARLLTALGIGAVLAAASCRPAPIAPPSDEPTRTPAVTTSDCPNIDLVSPAGNRVNLAGTWHGDFPTTLYYVWQRGACVWWAGGFATSETSDGFVYDGLGLFTMVFAGRITTDFTIEGTWSVVRGGPFYIEPVGGESMIVQITFAGSGEEEQVEMTLVSGGPPTRDIYDDHWTRISDVAIPPP